MQDEKSQLQNRERAMRVLRARLYERALAEQQAEVAASRAAQVGTGERAEKIRTYNYGERRVKDHRINLLLHNLDEILMGELDELTGALQDDEKRRRLEETGQLADAAVGAGKSVSAALSDATAALAAAGCDTPRLDAELLLSYVLGVGRERLVIDAHAELDPSDLARFAAVVARREAREPVAYILGRKAFRRIAVSVDRRVLIPRPETELLVEVALSLGRGARVADVGTGSGAVALSLKEERPDLSVVGIDVSAEALEVAR